MCYILKKLWPCKFKTFLCNICFFGVKKIFKIWLQEVIFFKTNFSQKFKSCQMERLKITRRTSKEKSKCFLMFLIYQSKVKTVNYDWSKSFFLCTNQKWKLSVLVVREAKKLFIQSICMKWFSIYAVHRAMNLSHCLKSLGQLGINILV